MKKSATRSAKSAKTTAKQTVAAVKAAAEVPLVEGIVKHGGLRRWNLWFGIVLLAQAATIALLGAHRSLPVTTSYQAVDPLSSEIVGHDVLVSAMRHLFDVNLTLVVALLLFVASLGYFATILLRRRYEADLQARHNTIRWTAFAASGGLIFVTLALLSGVASLSVLVAVLMFSLIGGFLGLLGERLNAAQATSSRLVYLIAAISIATPWLLIGTGVWSAYHYGRPVSILTDITYVVILGCFTALAFGARRYHARIGRWAETTYAERWFMAINFIAVTLLAWLTFAIKLHA